MGRNLLVCLDGTRNEPETGATNVVRLYEMAVKDDNQLVYYDPGVGTMGARSAVTPAGKRLTQAAGLVIGYGIRDNIEEAYGWLMEHYRKDDQIFVIGFSRGAYTALTLCGMLRTVGLLRPGAANLAPYALKLYAANGKRDLSKEERDAFWHTREDFYLRFGNPDFNKWSTKSVSFLGLWDTVKSVGWLNAKARYEQAHWPFTRKISNVEKARLAIAIDENRGPYAPYRFDAAEVAKRPDVREMWFAGVHSDVGGQYADHRLSDIALGWMADEAREAGLRLDDAKYEKVLGVAPGTPLPDSRAIEGRIHHHKWVWWLSGPGWRARTVPAGALVHPSVRLRMDATDYRPRFEAAP